LAASNLQEYSWGKDISTLQQQQHVALQNVDTMVMAVAYMTGYLRSSIAKTEPLALKNDSVFWIGPFAQVTFARFLVNLDTNCNHRQSADGVANGLECCSACKNNPSKAYEASDGKASHLNGAIWRYGSTTATSAKHPDDYIAIVLGGRNASSYQSIQDAKIILDWIGDVGCADDTEASVRGSDSSLLNAIGRGALQAPIPTYTSGNKTQPCRRTGNDSYPSDGLFIGQYASSLRMQFLASNRMGTGAAYFTMSVVYGHSKNHKTVQQITAASIPVGFSRAVYIWFFIFIVFNIYFTLDIFTTMRLSYLQTSSMRRFFQFFWNWITGWLP
jgi:hypothetical protein